MDYNVCEYDLEINNGIPILISEKTYIQKGLLNQPQKVYDFCVEQLRLNKKAEEYIYVLGLTTKGKILGVFEIGHGWANGSYCNPREIMIRLLLCGAVNFIVVHNHPSGDPSPSKDDIGLTKRLLETGKLMNIPCLDHVIIGEGFVSLKEYNFCDFK